jgi:hypothetical protein
VRTNKARTTSYQYSHESPRLFGRRSGRVKTFARQSEILSQKVYG